MKERYYIGIAHSAHDTAMAIVNGNGEVVFAEAAERRYQVKRAIGCPPDNMMWVGELMKKYCSPGADYIIAKSWSYKKIRQESPLLTHSTLRFDLNKNIKKTLLKLTNMSYFQFNYLVFIYKNYIAEKSNAGASIELAIRNQSISADVKAIAYDHHLSHAGLACYGSPFNEAVCYVADGYGENGSFSIYKYDKGKIIHLERQTGPVTLGGFYAGLTFVCGFMPIKGEEWKVMGMAAYGSFNERLHGLFMSMYRVEGTFLKFYKNKSETNKLFTTLQKMVAADPGNFSLKADIAYNGQLAYSQWMNSLISNIHKKYPTDNFILTGGCALNSSHNGKILDNTPFKNLYVPSAPGDDGNALGGALLAYYADNAHSESIHKNISPYLGTEINEIQFRNFLRFSEYKKIRRLEHDKYETIARLLADGKIIGLMQGKAEFGPRSLGNRSILADSRKKEIKDIVNERVKFREEFRPFAPSILHEYAHEYFENYQESHYMERTLTFKKEALEKVPGVVHQDNTGRLQSVKEEWNPEFYRLIKAFYNITGVPVLLNTSFNVMGKPIIHSIEDALSTFFTSGIDALVINDYLIEK